jgi:uncharacterized protein YdbL (DUF1318 family)
MAQFNGYELILETHEELQNLVEAIENSKKRDQKKVDEIVKIALTIAGSF